MRLISVTVFKDEYKSYPGGCIRTVGTKSQVLGMDANVYLQDFPSSCDGVDVNLPFSYLKIKDENTGKFFWLNETINSFASKVNSVDCCGFGAPGRVITITGGTLTPIVTDPQLYNLNIGTISKGGTVIYNVPYTSDSIGLTGSLDLTDFGWLSPQEILQITLKS